MKGQVLADFIAEFSHRNDKNIICNVESRPWKVFVDGASSAKGAEAGIVIITPEGIRLEHSFRLGFKASNNEAESCRIENRFMPGRTGCGDLFGFSAGCVLDPGEL